MSKYCHFHEDHRHDTNDCRQLRCQIKEAIKLGQLSHLVKGIKKQRAKSSENQQVEGKKDKGATPTEEPIIYTHDKARGVLHKGKCIRRIYLWRQGNHVSFSNKRQNLPSEHPIKISKGPSNSVFHEKKCTGLVVEIPLEITIGDPFLARRETLNFVIVRSDSPSNMLLGRTTMQKMGIVVSTIHEAIKFHTAKGTRIVFPTHESDKIKEGMKKVRETSPKSTKGILSCTKAEEKVVINDRYPEQTVTIRKQFPEHFKERLRDLLRSNADVFAWTHVAMTGIPITIMVEGKPFKTEHKLNEYSHIKPIKQKRRGLGPDRSTTACKEMEELTKAVNCGKSSIRHG
ncbi:hypothetical protein Tco_0204199 [Tanacetum coccineum]